MCIRDSCVPATEFDESGAELGYKDIDSYFEHKKVLGLAEMMNLSLIHIFRYT